MDKPINVDNILTQIKKLDYKARVYLMEQLAGLLKKDAEKTKDSGKLTELNGMGSEIWSEVNVEDYLQQERQWD